MFESARRKLDRAEHHIRDLDKVFTAFVHTDPHRAFIKGEVNDGEFVRFWVDVEFTADLPASLPLIIGDAIHNQRCALDHLMWELVAMDGGTQDRHLQFPLRDTRQNYEAACRGVKTPREDTKQLLVDFAAYLGGAGELLYAIHRLDNADKHTGLMPVVHVTQATVPLINRDTGERWRSDPIVARIITGRRATLIEAPAGQRIDAKDYIDPTPEIHFPEVEVVPDEPVVPTLLRLSDAISNVIGECERFVATRS